MKKMANAWIVCCAGSFGLAGMAQAESPAVPADVLALHQRMIVIDTHSDAPTQTLRRPGFDITQRHSYPHDQSQIDLPRMDEGGYDGGFFVVYTDPGPLTRDGYEKALAAAMREATAVRELAGKHPESFEFATTSADVVRIVQAGKKAVLMSMENSYPLGEDLRNLRAFHQLGLRMAGPVHSKNSQFADSATDKPQWHGLSPLGKRWVVEMNRLGIIIDISHSSDQAVDQMLALSKVPIIASHSGAKAMWDHPRNLDDARVKAVAAKGGVIQANSIFLGPDTRTGDVYALYSAETDLSELGPAEQDQALAAFRERFPVSGFKEKTDFDTFMNAVLYLLKLVGPDHVGIGPDWDGGGGVNGMEDISALPRITQRLKQAGYSDADIQKVWSGNLLRVMDQVQRAAAK
jgi:membrane dipeptidase